MNATWSHFLFFWPLLVSPSLDHSFDVFSVLLFFFLFQLLHLFFKFVAIKARKAGCGGSLL